jgi:UDP-N-acetylmuramoyl-L-alanyl-D-glutamate--2,6-diaminopimelate ligase
MMDWQSLLNEAPSYAGVASDSRDVKEGFIFVAGGGKADDHEGYLKSAIAAGAAVIVGEAPPSFVTSVPFLQVDDFRIATALLAERFYGGTGELLVVGVTGTCGKSTTTFLLESILAAAGHRVGLIGTVAFRYAGTALPSTHTTPGAIELYRHLAAMRAAGCTALVMEVSSHALHQHRVHGLLFDATVFTNLSLEHLDLHRTMDEYFRTKLRLFTVFADASHAAGKTPVAIVNVGDAHGRRLVEILAARGKAWPRVVPFSLGAVRDRLALAAAVTQGSFAPGVNVTSKLVGEFNAENILAAVAAGQALGLPNDAICSGVEKMTSVPGRLEPVPNSRGVRAFVDYAHKPGALEVLLRALTALRGAGRMLVVFGCGGERDRAKRPVMGGIATRFADEVWVTSDNPRSEDPEAIIREVMTGIEDASKVHAVVDRRQALQQAAAAALPGDILVVAGRGNEPQQIVAVPGEPARTMKVPFDDREVLRAALEAVS